MRHFILGAALASAVVAIAVMPQQAASAPRQTFWAAGTWKTTVRVGNQVAHLTLVITQKGNSVSGTYGEGGSISGLMNGNTFSGRYKDSTGNGWVNFQFSQDGSSFVGNYGSSPGVVAGDWHGKKAGATPPPAPPATGSPASH